MAEGPDCGGPRLGADRVELGRHAGREEPWEQLSQLGVGRLVPGGPDELNELGELPVELFRGERRQAGGLAAGPELAVPELDVVEDVRQRVRDIQYAHGPRG